MMKKMYKVYKTSQQSIVNNINSVMVIISNGELNTYENNELDDFNYIVDFLKNDINYMEM